MKRFISFCSIILLTPLFYVSAQTSGTCATGNAEAYLDINNVRARLVNTGGLFWKGDPSVYNVPKNSQSNAIFAHGLWLSGYTETDELRVAGANFGNWEFWPGPLDAQANPPKDCSLYDRLYKISGSDIVDYNTTKVASKDLSEWPWQLGAPVKDGDGNPNNYDLSKGDRPDLLGDQMVWWVMNDVGNVHNQTQTKPLGVEIQVLAYAFDRHGDIGNTTFYRYRLKNKSPNRYKDFIISYFSDPDLGDSSNDYIGTDTTRSMVYGYNAYEKDSTSNTSSQNSGTGQEPPALGIDFLHFPVSRGENQVLGYSINMGSGHPIICPPVSGSIAFRYCQTSRFLDGRRLSAQGDGTSGIPPFTNFAFHGDPVTGHGWSEMNNDGRGSKNSDGNRAFAMSTQPATFSSGEVLTLDFAIVWAQEKTALGSLVALRRASDTVQGFFDAGFQSVKPISSPELSARYENEVLQLNWKNNPNGTNRLNDYADTAYGLQFEGYVVRQYKSASDSVGTIVAIYDQENGIKNIYAPTAEDSRVTERLLEGSDSGLQMYHIVSERISLYFDYHFGVQQPYAINSRVGQYPFLHWGDVSRISITPKDLAEETAPPQEQLSRIGITPNPYKFGSPYETTTSPKEIRLVGIPRGSTIRIFSLDGQQVKYFWQAEETGYVRWFLENDRGNPIASGMYLVHVSVSGVGERVLKFGAVMRGK
ncbi:MAG: hypothetical protein J0L94_00320 [Rhodothermia bacterium]|nr:hypothetical protein [Rhodothermia bacterium]